VRHVRGVAADGAPINVSDAECPLMATMSTGAWLASGNLVEVMQNGDGTYPRLWHLAQHRSHVHGIVIDSRIGWTGGFGIDDRWFGDGRSNGSWGNQRALRRTRDQAAAGRVCGRIGGGDGRDVQRPATVVPHEHGATAAGLLYTTPTLGCLMIPSVKK
jgi:hypothetical protein